MARGRRCSGAAPLLAEQNGDRKPLAALISVAPFRQTGSTPDPSSSSMLSRLEVFFGYCKKGKEETSRNERRLSSFLELTRDHISKLFSTQKLTMLEWMYQVFRKLKPWTLDTKKHYFTEDIKVSNISEAQNAADPDNVVCTCCHLVDLSCNTEYDNRCNMTDIMQRISLSRPPVKQSMYKTLYMRDYTPYDEFQNQIPMMDLSKKLQLETQLKKKEFERPVEKEPMKYAEEPIYQEIEPPYPVKIDESLSSNQEAPLAFQQVERDQEKYYLPSEPTAFQKKEAESITPQRDTFAMPGTPCIRQELGQNWNNYQQFMLEMRRANQTQLKEIKKSHLGSSVFQADFVINTDASTYQRDYKHWSSVRSGFYQANRNFSNFFFHDGYYNENPWTSEYMDNYNIFLKKLNRKTQNPVSTFCSTVRPIPSLSPEISTQTPIAVNTAP